MLYPIVSDLLLNTTSLREAIRRGVAGLVVRDDRGIGDRVGLTERMRHRRRFAPAESLHIRAAIGQDQSVGIGRKRQRATPPALAVPRCA